MGSRPMPIALPLSERRERNGKKGKEGGENKTAAPHAEESAAFALRLPSLLPSFRLCDSVAFHAHFPFTSRALPALSLPHVHASSC